MRPKAAFSIAFAFAVLLSASVFAEDNQPLIVHEWGTFTSLQDETGAALGGINTDDEPVPQFVHRLSDWLLLRPTEMPPCFFQGAPACHPDVTMRLETPVIYFHLSRAGLVSSNITVRAQFNGGWLSEFYPSALATAPGLVSNTFEFGPLQSDTISSLTWSNMEIGGNWEGPTTSAHVWTSPRAVEAANVRTTSGEAERFLFYRGVAHLDAPLRISTDSGELTFRSQLEDELKSKHSLPIHSLWLVSIRSDGTLAFRTLPQITLDDDPDKILAKTPAAFKSSDYSSGNFGALKKRLHAALVGEGLFPDEAQALLNTWELSYFKSPGLRVFFLVPRVWTDAYLPLQISPPATINRVMVGRIELITPGQREILRQISEYPHKSLTNDWAELHSQVYRQPVINRFQKLGTGEESFEDASVPVPRSYDLYLRLGRFRQTLVLTEQNLHPSPGMQQFISAYALRGNGLMLSRAQRQVIEQATARRAAANSASNKPPNLTNEQP